MKKSVSGATLAGTLLAFLMVGTLTLGFNVRSGNSSSNIITVPTDYLTIQAAINAANPGDTVYVEAGTYHENILVNKTLSIIGENMCNTTIDGDSPVKDVVYVCANHVNVTGFRICNSLAAGVSIVNAHYCSISKSNMTDNDRGIWLNSSSHNNIIENEIVGVVCVYLFFSNTTSVVGNNIRSIGGGTGIQLQYSCNNNIAGNNITDGTTILVSSSSSNNSIAENNITNGLHGVYFSSSSNNKVTGNNITDCGDGVYVYHCSNNSIAENNITRGQCGVRLEFSSGNNITSNNITNSQDGVYAISSSGESIIGNNIMANTQRGIYLSSTGSGIIGNNITKNAIGVYLFYPSAGNTFHHNNFINNTQQVGLYQYTYENAWDDGSQGNYWSDYLVRYPDAKEIDGSGIGDTPYVIDAKNTDRYPLIGQSPTIPEFPSPIILVFMLLTILANITVYKRCLQGRRLISQHR